MITLKLLIITVLCVVIATSDATPDVGLAINSFANKIYDAVGNTNDNLIFSPFSLHSILAFLSQGAGGKTLSALYEVLDLPKEANAAVGSYRRLTETVQRSTSDIELRVANKIFVKTGYHLKEDFLSTAKDGFNADVGYADFNQNTADEVNAWVSNKTEGKISHIVDANDFDESTRALLLNAVYFKGKWAQPFKAEDTLDEKFFKRNGESVDCRMMKQTAGFGYAEYAKLDARVLEMKYKDPNYSMVIVLPNGVDGLQELEKKLSNEDVNALIDEYEYESVQVSLPRFTVESLMDLKEPLQQIGLSEIFSYNANFTNMLETKEDLKIEKVIQKAYVDVNEEGSEAAAATVAQLVTLMSGPMPFPNLPKVFKADHPFMFYITGKLNGNDRSILFMGKVVDMPSISAIQ